MQDDPPEDEPEESQSDNSDVDDGDAVDISGIEIEVGNTDGGDSNEVEEPPQNLVRDDSLAGDIESIVASDIFVDEATQQDKCQGIGWQRDAYDFDDGGMLHAEWDVNLGEFLNDVEDDPDAATMLGTDNEFDLDAESPSDHVSLGGESDFDIERDAAIFGAESQSNSYVSSEEESIVSDVYPAKQSKIGVVVFVCFVAFVSLIAVTVSMFDIIRFLDMH